MTLLIAIHLQLDNYATLFVCFQFILALSYFQNKKSSLTYYVTPF